MDSCNSGSLESSSGGEEEFDSRAESISTFFNSSTTTTTTLPSLPHHAQPQQWKPSSSSSFFDPLSSYIDALPPFLTPDPDHLNPSSSWTKPFEPSPSMPHPSCTNSGLINASSSDLPSTGSTTSSSQPQRGPKKRSRATRRAATTVLTTDTSNFRAMVQEFTGIPTPPFASSLSFSRPRLDLLHTTAMPPYLLRPFAHKVQAQASPFSSIPSSSMLDAIPSSITGTSTNANTSIPTITTTITRTTSDTSGLCLRSNNQGLELLNMGSPMFNFQSLPQPPNTTKYSLPMVAFGERTQTPVMVAAVDYGTESIGHAARSEGMNLRGRTGEASVWVEESGPEDGNRAQFRPVIASTSAARSEGVMDSWVIPSD